MQEFTAKHHDQIAGTLSGFDRLVFRGTLRSIVHDAGMQHYLRANHILLKEFAAPVDQVTRRLKEASLAEAEALGRPVQDLPSPQASKEEIARGIADLHRRAEVSRKAAEEARRRSAWVTRKLRLLRAHGPITKIIGTHRYQLTPSGRKAITAILMAL